MNTEIMKNYEVEYVEKGKKKILRIEADNPGQAFAKAQKQRGEAAVMLRCVIESHIVGAHFWIEYEAPKSKRRKSTPVKHESIEQIVMPWA